VRTFYNILVDVGMIVGGLRCIVVVVVFCVPLYYLMQLIVSHHFIPLLVSYLFPAVFKLFFKPLIKMIITALICFHKTVSSSPGFEVEK
jgi:hypothetical protein